MYLTRMKKCNSVQIGSKKNIMEFYYVYSPDFTVEIYTVSYRFIPFFDREKV